MTNSHADIAAFPRVATDEFPAFKGMNYRMYLIGEALRGTVTNEHRAEDAANFAVECADATIARLDQDWIDEKGRG